MLQESTNKGQWPSGLKRKDWDNILNLGARRELEKLYGQEVQILCKTPSFGAASTDNLNGIIDKSSLNKIVDVVCTKAPFISSMVFSVGPTSYLPSSASFSIIFMKLTTILVILCRLAHRNNSNYFPLLIALYMYFAGAQVDAITLHGHLGLSVSYPVLFKKLGDITTTSQRWIKQQATNCQLVGTWDNFEFRENVSGERVDDVVKFRSITMALWIKKGWRIPEEGLQQAMWNLTNNLLDPLALLLMFLAGNTRISKLNTLGIIDLQLLL